MTTQPVTLAGAPTWIDLSTSDQGVSRTFYGELFGWQSQEPDPQMGGYLNFTLAGERVAGCLPAIPGMPGTLADVWTVYLATDDAESVCRATMQAGGTVIAPALDVMDLGRMAVVADPSGAPIGVWQAGTHPGLITQGEPGHAAWFELLTRDHDATISFCQTVFGWEPQQVADQPGFRYTTGRIDGQDVVGVMTTGEQRPEGSSGVAAEAPAQWSVYFGVEDTDASLQRAIALGATVVHPPSDSPHGRVSAFTDPTGTLVKIIA